MARISAAKNARALHLREVKHMIFPLLPLLFATFQSLWSAETGHRLIECVDASGVAVVSDSVNAVLLNEDGSVKTRLRASNGFTPIRVSHSQGLEMTAAEFTTFQMPNSLVASPLGTVLGRQGGIVRVGGGVLVVSKLGLYARTGFDQWSGIGLSDPGDCIVTIDRPMNAPVLRVHRFVSGGWKEDQDSFSPEVEGAGFASPYPGYNDVVFVGQNTVCFIGGIYPAGGSSDSLASKVIDRWLLSPSIFVISDHPKPEIGYLFSFNIKTRVTTVLSKVHIAPGSMRSPSFGHLAGSFDGSYLYVLGVNGILRLRAEDVLRVRPIK